MRQTGSGGYHRAVEKAGSLDDPVWLEPSTEPPMASVKTKRRRWLFAVFVALAVLLALALFVAGWWLFSGHWISGEKQRLVRSAATATLSVAPPSRRTVTPDEGSPRLDVATK